MTDEELRAAAMAEVREKKRQLIEKFVGASFPSVTTPVAIFMAGSPGAGKTEFSKNFAQAFARGDFRTAFPTDIDLEFSPIVRIDPDEIRGELSQYDGRNAHLFQAAVSAGVNRLIDYCQDKRKSFILDGTFSKLQVAKGNVERALGKKRPVIIAYLYQDPMVAWDFTQQREKLEGRRITKEIFVDDLFAAKDVVQRIKDEFGPRVQVWFIKRDLGSPIYTVELNVDKIDGVVKIPYSKEELLSKL